jgi:mRNA interferase RelE/StbE
VTDSYKVLIAVAAERELRDLPAKERPRITKRILALSPDPRPPGCKKLSGLDGYRLRVDRYRVLYVVADEARIVTIYEIGHRREVYW